MPSSLSLKRMLCLNVIGWGVALMVGLAWTSPAYAQGPVLQAINPVSNTHTAPLNTTVSATYDQAMDIATVSPGTFAAHAMQTGLLPQSYGVNGGTLILTPTNPFKPGELMDVAARPAYNTVKVKALKGLKDMV